MRTTTLAIAFVALFSTAAPCPAQQRAAKVVPPGLEAQVKKFFVEKEAQAQALTKEEKKEQMPEVWDFFTAGQNGDWVRVASIYRQLRRGAYQYENTKADPRLETMVWQPINEGYGAYEQCANMEEKYVTLFAREILDSMPPGSIFFGGNDPGRWIPTAFSTSHTNGDPCFVLTQNALADSLYLKYLRSMYGHRIAMPSDEDSKKAFDDYMRDAEARLKKGQLRPGEDVKMVDGKVQVSGQVAVMAINALLVRKIFDTNPRREFFVVESFPLDWMYPHLSPHGLMMKLNREPLPEMTAAAVQKDWDYWMRFTDGALGKWLRPTTSVDEICDFADRVFVQEEMSDFKGDLKFVRNSYATKSYSKLRSAIGGVYAWRAKNTTVVGEKERMMNAADFAFRQAYALCPSSPEAVFRYVSLLVEQKRFQDARRLVEVAQNLDPAVRSYQQLLEELDRLETTK